MDYSDSCPDNVPEKEQPARPKSGRQHRREKDWIKKCVSQFSLYANLVGNNCHDPSEEAAAIEAGEFKQKVSKSTKKRLRRQRKANRLKVDSVIGRKAAQIKKLNDALAKKKTKKDMKAMIAKLSNLPL